MKILRRKSECRAVSPDLWDYVGERLPENALERVENHLTICADCQTEVEGMRRAQNLLRDCRSQVPAPRSDWHDLQNRMRAEGMISPLSGRILTQELGGQTESTRTPRRPVLALNWERLSLAGSVAATLLLSVSIYRLTAPPTQYFASNQTTVPNFVVQPNHTAPREAATEASMPLNLGDPFRQFLTPVNLSTSPQLAEQRNSEASQASADNQQDEPEEKTDNPASPIIWNKSQRPHSPAPQRKYVALSTPLQADKTADHTAIIPPALDMSKNAQDAKTRYIMRRLTPASYIEEEGIY